jgi:hypothetical protein
MKIIPSTNPAVTAVRAAEQVYRQTGTTNLSFNPSHFALVRQEERLWN